jgi:hypothetical protein
VIFDQSRRFINRMNLSKTIIFLNLASMRHLIFTFILTIFSVTSKAQNFEVPPMDIKPTTQVEYEAMEPTVLSCINWLNTTPLSIDAEKHTSANAYFMLWLTGTQKVNVVVDGYVLNYAEKNPELLMAFMIGWSKLALEQGEKDNFKLALAGVTNLVHRYKNNVLFFKKDKKLKKLAEISDRGELEAWLKNYVN